MHDPPSATQTQGADGLQLSFTKLSYSINKKPILQNVSGYVRPGQILGILGHHGCGMSSLIELLAGVRHLDNRSAFTGEFLVNGAPRDSSFASLSGFVSQGDFHFPTLTVRETVEYSLLFRGDSQQRERSEEVVRATLDLLGLTAVADELVGNERILPRVSKPVLKRLTLAVETVLDKRILMLDNAAEGMDGPTSHQLYSTVRTLANSGITVILGAGEISWETCKLFDSILLLSYGRMIFFGHRSECEPFFSSLGFVRPVQLNPVDYYRDLTEDPARHAPSNRTGLTPAQLSVEFEKSSQYASLGTKLWTEFAAKSGEDVANTTAELSEEMFYTTSFREQYWLTISRALRLAYRDPGLYRVRFLRSIVLGLCLGSLFWNIGLTQVNAEDRMSLLFFALSWAGIASKPALRGLFEEREMFYEQRKTKWYRTRAFVFASTAVEVLLSSVEVGCFAILVYLAASLASGMGSFINFYLLLLGVKLSSHTWLRACSAWLPDDRAANALSMLGLGGWFVLSGFLLARDQIPTMWKWCYHSSFFRYAFEGLAINEQTDIVYDCNESELLPPVIYPGYNGKQACPITTGTVALSRYGIDNDKDSIVVCLGAVYGFFAAFLLLYYFGLQYYRPPSSEQVFVLFSEGGIFSRLRKSAIEKQRKYMDISLLLETTSTAVTGILSVIQRVGVGLGNIQGFGDLIPMLQTTSPAPGEKAKGMYMLFSDIGYQVLVPAANEPVRGILRGKTKNVLQSVSGYARPGMLLTIFGPSGSGRSTLLDILAGRDKPGLIVGTILVNDQPRNFRTFRRMRGYVGESTPMVATQTLREMVEFSAVLRLPRKMPFSIKQQKVDAVLDGLRLNEYGSCRISDLTPGVRKRLALAAELVADPMALFLDSPTEGLSSGAALTTMKLIRKIAESGRTVVMTSAPQPRAEILELYDWMLFLDGMGRQTFFGEIGKNGSNLVDFFSPFGVAPSTLDFMSPTDYALAVCADLLEREQRGSLPSKSDQDAHVPVDAEEDEQEDNPSRGLLTPAVSAFRESGMFARMKSAMDSLVPPDAVFPVYQSRFSASFVRQLYEVLWRTVITGLRQEKVFIARIVRSAIMGLVFGSMFYNLGNDQISARSRIVVVYLCIIFVTLAPTSLIPQWYADRAVFYRDKDTSMYSSTALWMANILAEIPVLFVSAYVFSASLYFLTDQVEGGSRLIL
eukprot:TRINITY_DN455_c1_g1_i2.p1 TRINITY_DN455_c1_g1~~TRINITY_DN455_c1_g1_i2.p1  ORF type:complete len:1195 (+),score=257.01 TRINITY_DN455_c1_g1_i2:5-3589(+)